MIPITASDQQIGAKSTDACGNSSNEKRTKPYAPILRITPASTTEPAVGASVCTSGQPRVEREQRRLDRERGHEAEEEQQLGGAREPVPLREHPVVEREDAGVGLVEEREHERRREQERRTGRGVEEELRGRVLAAFAPPPWMRKYIGTSMQLPEDEEQR